MRNYDLNPLRRSSAGPDRPFDQSDGMLQHEGENDCPPRDVAPFAHRAFPTGTRAIIYRPARSAMTSGKANTRHWKLRFMQRAAPFIEPLMGWTGGTDTLSQVELDFPSAEAAIAYARRKGLDFVVQGLAEAPQTRCPMAAKSKPGGRDGMDAQVVRPCTRKFEWVERTLGVGATNNGIDFDLALTNPAAALDERERVVCHPQLSAEQKREILRRWALEAYRAEDAKKRRTARTDISRLDKVIDALIDLEDPDGVVIRGKQITNGGGRAA